VDAPSKGLLYFNNLRFCATCARSCQKAHKLKVDLFLKKEHSNIFFKMRSAAGFRSFGRLLGPAPTTISS